MKSLKQNGGFTLIELIVAIGILAITGTTIFIGFVNSSRIHNRTTSLQMGEDVAQLIAEEFKSYPLSAYYEKKTTPSGDVVTGKYAANTTEEVDATTGDTAIKISGISYAYAPKADMSTAQFTANITLTPYHEKDAAGNVKTGRKTTYTQNKEVDYFYALDESVDTNTFIIPEVTNIYDGSCVVLSEDINQYDSRVVNDLYQVIRNDLAKRNSLISLPANQINLAQFDADFSSKYIPLTNINDDKMLVKHTEIELDKKSAGSGVEYYYKVKVWFEFDFDFSLLLGNGNPAGSLSSVVSSGNISAVTGAASLYNVKHSGSKYKVEYFDVATEVKDPVTGVGFRDCSFCGLINVDSDLSTPDVFEAKYTAVDGDSSSETAKLFILYTPFDMYSDDTSDAVANDVVEFRCSGSPEHVVRAFFVTQEIPSMYSPDNNIKIDGDNCEYNSPKANFRVYTNDKDILGTYDSTNPLRKNSNGFGGGDYLTNSQGTSKINTYQMKIELFNLDGVKVAELNTIKED